MMTVENQNRNGEIRKKVGDYISDLSLLPNTEENAPARLKLHGKIQRNLDLINDPETEMAVQAYYDGTGTTNPYQ